MREISDILVPTDFSESAHAALGTAIGLAKALDASVHVAHVLHSPVQLSALGQMPIPPDLWSQVRNSAARKLDEAAKTAAAEGVRARTHLTEGPNAQAIVELADKIEADLIVMGTRGLSGLKHVMLGSVAERTVRLAHCPVLTVKANHTGRLNPQTIVVPIDFSGTSSHALELARDLARAAGPAHIVLVHACEVPIELAMYAPDHSAPFVEKLSEDASKRLASTLADLQDAGISAEYLLLRGSPDAVINRLAEERKADLIAMGTHGRTGLPHLALGSIAERVVRTAPCPVLTVKDPAR